MVEPDSQETLLLAGGVMAATSRVNGQVEVFVQGTDKEPFKAWWS